MVKVIKEFIELINKKKPILKSNSLKYITYFVN